MHYGMRRQYEGAQKSDFGEMSGLGRMMMITKVTCLSRVATGDEGSNSTWAGRCGALEAAPTEIISFLSNYTFDWDVVDSTSYICIRST